GNIPCFVACAKDRSPKLDRSGIFAADARAIRRCGVNTKTTTTVARAWNDVALLQLGIESCLCDGKGDRAPESVDTGMGQ
ncbi:MAG: hypothetical protein AAFU49_21860, partial [Pseudomonadota bacterium]